MAINKSILIIIKEIAEIIKLWKFVIWLAAFLMCIKKLVEFLIERGLEKYK